MINLINKTKILLLTILVASCFSVTAFASQMDRSKDSAKVMEQNVDDSKMIFLGRNNEYLENGMIIKTEVFEKRENNNSSRAVSEYSFKKYIARRTIYNSKGKIGIILQLEGQFRYNGKVCACIKSTPSIRNANRPYSARITYYGKNSNCAKANYQVYYNGKKLKNVSTLKIMCSVNGKIKISY